MNTITRPVTAPNDLRTAGAMPRRKSPDWEAGDIVQDSGIRWIIRVIVGDAVELEASNGRCEMWWRTTLDKLPPKAARP